MAGHLARADEAAYIESCLENIAARLRTLDEQAQLQPVNIVGDDTGANKVEGATLACDIQRSGGATSEACAASCCTPGGSSPKACFRNAARVPAATEWKNACSSKQPSDPALCCESASVLRQSPGADSCCNKASGPRQRLEADSCCKDAAEPEQTSGVVLCCKDAAKSSQSSELDLCSKPGGKKPCCTDDKVNGVKVTLHASCCTADASVREKMARLPDGDDEPLCSGDCCDATEKISNYTGSGAPDHLKAALDRFEQLLQRGRCLCRQVLRELDFCCCCGSSAASSTSSFKDQKQEAGCCNDVKCTSRMLQAPSKQRTGKVCNKSTPAIPCGRELPKDCCDQLPSGGRSACSKESPLPQGKTKFHLSAAPPSKDLDVENAAAREQVVLNVTGMTCTGCSKKMLNVLRDMNGISNPQVTFVSGVASFELDASVAKIDDVIPLVMKKTGFKVDSFIGEYQQFDLMLDDQAARSFERDSKAQIVSFKKLKSKETYRVTYDPSIIGARDLLPFGARLVAPVPDVSAAAGRKRLISMTTATTLSAILTIPIVVLAWSDNLVRPRTAGIVSLVLATFVQAIAVPEFYVGALKSLVFSKVIEMDMLVVISITAAYCYSVVAFGLTETGTRLETEAFFETSSLLITLVLLGRLIAAIARMRAVSAVSLQTLQVQTAMLVQEDGGVGEIDARLLQFGDVFRVQSHAHIVTDGIVLTGTSDVNESMLTGESMPVNKAKGENVVAGTVNGSGPLDVRLMRLPGANSITDIRGLVENALSAKPRVQDLADRVASWFIPTVVAIALIVFAIWMAVAVEVRDANAGGAVGTAITYGIAVLAISCPCALGLAVPMVLVIAGGVAARSGVIIKKADALERGHNVTDVLFDKTGTITTSDLTVIREELTCLTELSDDEARSLVRALVNDNSHPVSQAISKHLTNRTSRCATHLNDQKSIPGCGVQAQWNGQTVKAGNPHWLSVSTHATIGRILGEGLSVLCVTIDDQLVVAYGLKSTLRDDAVKTVLTLQHRGIRCHLVSGDHEQAVHAIATAVGIDLANTIARSTPAEKKDYVERLQSDSRVVLFCGDGTNDAVAIAQANIGVQMGTASDVIKSVSAVTLLGGLDGILSFLAISKRAFIRIVFNFVWSAVYNVFAILLAAGALSAVGFRIPPAYAGLGEMVSVAPVVLAAASLVMKSRW